MSSSREQELSAKSATSGTPRISSGGSDTRSVSTESKSIAPKNDPKNKNLQPAVVSVVQEQAETPNFVHIMPNSTGTNTGNNVPTNQTGISNQPTIGSGNSTTNGPVTITRQMSSSDVNKNTSPTNVGGGSDSFLTHLKSKRSVIEGPVSEEAVRAKKAGPSSSLMNLRNTNTVSSTTTVQSKASSRAEFFAAKLHDAIKVDDKNSSDSDETFVYDTSANERPTAETETANEETLTLQQPAIDDAREKQSSTGTVQSTRPDDVASEIVSNMSEAGVLQNNFNSTNSQDIHVEATALPHGTDKNKLRQITSRVFDSKGVNPRRYSGMNFDNDPEENYRDQQLNEGDLYSDSGEEMSLSDHAYNYGSINSDGYYNNYPSGLYFQQPVLESRNGKVATNKLKRKPNNLYFSPHDFTGAREVRIRQIKSFCYTVGLIFVLLSVGFISGFILATTKELQHTTYSISDLIISQEELVFNLGVESFNPGFLDIVVQDANIDVFARSEFVLGSEDVDKPKKKPPVASTVLLGTVTGLDVPLRFQGGFFTRQKDVSVTEIKVLNPCSFEETDEMTILEPSEKWLNISRNPFDLILRGVLSYQLPISTSNQTMSISKTMKVSPQDLGILDPGVRFTGLR
ncbi:hypothetical protein OGAPHI_001538 [Ogataea philodendri]|uniref:Vacuolar segregation protein 7 n=1 Tax=Ogataea philodendri TaxID=1378263 RepID=A0A9P8PDQ8_9ASCO|nr:uncharacterized protein OGAPHI_001538 [Ogataea philodendri]KAH3669417.1 hypothetical protein OGAPHI_001538 [Ogataea philodendri]